MSDPQVRACCSSLGGMLFVIITLIIYKTRDYPSFYIENFYVQALNATSTTIAATNTTIFFDLKLHNQNLVTGLYYDDPLYLTLSYVIPDNYTVISIGEYAMHGFYQGNGKTKHVRNLLDTRGWPLAVSPAKQVRELVETFEELVPNLNETISVVVFRVDLVTKVRFKLWWNHRRHRLAVGANVEVNEKTGEKVAKKGIKLIKSGAAAKLGWFLPRAAVMFLSTAFILIDL